MMSSVLAFAVLADVHGNSWALEAVLADISRRSVSKIFNLGDCVYGPLDPAGAADLLMGTDLISVRGNQDRVLLESLIVAPPPGSTLTFVRAALTAVHQEWLGSLPVTAHLEHGFFLCHGTPRSDEECLLENIRPAGVFLRSPSELGPLVNSVDCEVVLCAHSHVPRTVWAAGRLVVNPGSVGLPAYTDDLPFPHAMEVGSPHARYALLSREDTHDRWRVEHISVSYDWETAANVADGHGRKDWAQWLHSGRTTVV